MKIILSYKKPIFDENLKIIEFEIYNKYIIEYSNKKKGGDIFDDIDDIIIQKKSSNSTASTFMNETRTKEHKQGSVINITNIKINENMTIFDLKMLIYNITNINIEDQHIEQNTHSENDEYKNIEYEYENIDLMISIDTCLNNLLNDNNNQLYEIPLDLNLMNNRYLYIIKELSKVRKVNDLKYIKNLEIDIFNINDFIQNKEQLNKQLMQDNENLNNIYYGFIEKYFPYYTIDLFKYFLKSDNKLDLYPNLFVEKNKIINKLDELNKLENMKLSKNELKSSIKKLNIKIESYKTEKIINMQSLFNIIELQKFNNIHKIRCKLNINDKLVYLEKINLLDTKYNDITLIGHDVENSNIITFLITITNNKFKLINSIINVTLDEYNNIYLTFFPNENFNIEDYKLLIENEINKIITQLNKLLKMNITIINKYNLKVETMDSEYLIDNTSDNILYNDIIKTFQNNEYLGYYKITEYDDILNKIDLKLKYININTYINETKLNNLTDNYFIFNIDPILIEKYSNIIYTSRISIQIRVDDIRIIYTNIHTNEYNDISTFFIKLIKKSLTKNITKSKNLINANKIKILKETDPKLYIINKFDNKNLYSRKCQSNKQPIIVQPTDIKSKKNVTKYWNFTKNKPEYYSCDSKKFPYIKFLTGIHPNNYCIPCCRKRAADDIKIFSSYQNIHKKCLQSFTYSKDETETTQLKSRYIMNYSCKITLESNRMMELPISLKKIFSGQYDVTNDDTTYYIKGVNQNFINVNNVSLLHILAMILDKNTSDVITFINNFLISNPNIINNLIGGKLLNYITNISELIKLINNTFNSSLTLHDFKSFNLWNEFFIDISKFFGYKYIIIDEFDNNTINDSKLKLLLNDNIKNVSGFINNNDNYKYIILIRRNINSEYYYYPILKLNYKEYFTDVNKFKIAFNYDDQVILKIKNIYKITLDNTPLAYENISLDLIHDFILVNNTTTSYKIIKYYVNKKMEIYSILIQINNKNMKESYIYLNVDNKVINDISYINLLKSKLYDFKTIKINMYDIFYRDVNKFILDVNKFIFDTNKIHYTDIFYKKYLNDIIMLNKDILKLDLSEIKYLIFNDKDLNLKYTYLRIQSFILNQNKIIGVVCNNLNIYITESIEVKNGIKTIENKYNYIRDLLKSNKIKKKSIENLFTREFSLENNTSSVYKLYIPDIVEIPDFSKYKNYFKYFKYNPFVINNIINSLETIPDNRQLNINKAIYETNLYNLLILHIVEIIKKIKNTNIRNKLKLVIYNFTKEDINNIIIYKSNKKIYEIINTSIDKTTSLSGTTQKTYIKIILSLKTIIFYNKQQPLQKIKNLCLDIISNTRFEFDNLYLYELLKLNKSDFLHKLDKLVENVIIYKNVNKNENIIDLTLCNNTKKSYYCNKNKLIIDKNIYKKMMDIFYYDITNPFKQQLLLNFTNINNDLYKFNNYINEKIYIYY